MKIVDHRLIGEDGTPMAFRASPNCAGAIDHKYIVIHYTAGVTARSAELTFANRAAKASAHLIIDRDGEILQMVPFNVRAWHAGVSRWRGLDGLNAYSIGIELVNAGRLKRASNRWLTWTGGVIAEEDAIEATHQHESAPAGWQLYPEAQLMAAIRACQAIMQAYPSTLDVVGHDDIAPGRKSDPGPAFPMDSFRSNVLGRADDNEMVRYRTTTRVNLRTGPGAAYDLVQPSPLLPGTLLNVRSRSASWCAVDVIDAGGQPSANGWVHGDYIIAAP